MFLKYFKADRQTANIIDSLVRMAFCGERSRLDTGVSGIFGSDKNKI